MSADTGTAVDAALATRLSLALGRLVRSLRREVGNGLGPSTLSSLGTLVACGPIRLGDLAAREGVAPPTLTRIVSALEEAGYASRSPDPADRRASLVQATAAGHEVISGLRSGQVNALVNRLDAMPPGEREKLLAAIPALELLADDDS
jgi:DNA-binding MarR family transcriptional regulator